MKRFINGALSVISPLAAVPTGWAIFAGITEQPAFPVPPVWAGIGAVAVVVVNFAAGMLITDIDNFNHSNMETERQYSYPLWRAWAVLVVGILAEIVLSLLIVVYPNALRFGVLAFPIMTFAGVFVISIRTALMQREGERGAMRLRVEQERKEQEEKAEQEVRFEQEQAEKKRLERAEQRRQARLEREKVRLEATSKQEEPATPAFICATCGYEAKSQAALNGHQIKHRPIKIDTSLLIKKDGTK